MSSATQPSYRLARHMKKTLTAFVVVLAVLSTVLMSAIGCGKTPRPTKTADEVIERVRQVLSVNYIGSEGSSSRTKFFGEVVSAKYLEKAESVPTRERLAWRKVEAGNWLIEVREMTEDQELRSGQWTVTSSRPTGFSYYFTCEDSTGMLRIVQGDTVKDGPTPFRTSEPNRN